MFALAGKRIWVAGHRGMVGSALVRRLGRERCKLLTIAREQLDLRRQADVEDWMALNQPEVVFICAARVGGILANSSQPVDFLYENLSIAANLIHGAVRSGVQKLMFLGSACLYPRLAPQPIPETAMLDGPPEPTNQWNSVAKIAGVKLCQAYRRQYGFDFISVVPAGLYGPGDRFDPQSGHVVAGLIRRTHEAKSAGAAELSVWGSGKPIREFMHVDDCADALTFLMSHYSDESPINVGTQEETSIGELARRVAGAVGFTGRLVFDTSKPDGMPRKLLDSSRIFQLGWRPQISLPDGLAQTYRWFVKQPSPVEASATAGNIPKDEERSLQLTRGFHTVPEG
jgi:GDP-L-fucose synthase